MVHSFLFSSIDGVALLNDDGGVEVFFPDNSFVTNTTLTHTNTPRRDGEDHIAFYGGDPLDAQVTWHNSGGLLQGCSGGNEQLVPCEGCGPICQANKWCCWRRPSTQWKHRYPHVHYHQSLYESRPGMPSKCIWWPVSIHWSVPQGWR